MTTISHGVVVFLVLCASMRLRCFVLCSAFSTPCFLSSNISGLFRSIFAPLLAVNWRATLKIRDVSDLGVKVIGRESLITTNDIGKAAMVIGYKVIPEELLVRLRSCCSI